MKHVLEEFGVAVEGKDDLAIAGELAYAMQEDYGTRKSSVTFLSRAPEKRRALWAKLGVTPRGIDRETSEMMHRTHMGVDNDWVSILLHAMRNALSDGWGGSMIATEVSDILFGTPQPVKSFANIGVLKEDHVNIVVHGHNPVVSETIVAACQNPELVNLAKDKGAACVNLTGVCCTGNELMMRHGVPMAGNHLTTELVLVTGAVEMMIVDYQCIMPAIGLTATRYHTKMISTSDKAKFPGMEHHEFSPENAQAKAGELVRPAIENFSKRNPAKVSIPVEPQEVISGISVEAILAGSLNVVKLLTEGLNDVVGATFAVEPDPEKAAKIIIRHIEGKRKALGLDSRNV